MKVSIDFLSSEDSDAVMRYQELAIFSEDEFVPEAAISTLWAHTGNMKKRNVGRLLVKLKDRSLLRLDGEAPNRVISLHDLQFDYLRATAGDLTHLHNNLLEAYSKICSNKWSSGPEDGYFYKHLAYHMKEAGKKEELRNLLLNFEWMCSKLKKECVIHNETEVKKPDVNSLLHDYDYLPDDTEIGLVQGAIKLSFSAIVKDNTQLAGQLLGRLLCFHEEGIQSLLSQAYECKDGIRSLPRTSSLKLSGGPLIRTFEGHDGCVSAVAITPDGKFAISASHDMALKVWDLEKGEEKITLKGHDDGVIAVAITPDGKYVVSASHDRTLKVWDLEKGEEKITLRGHDVWVNAVIITPDGKYVVSASNDCTLKVWDLGQGVIISNFTGDSSFQTCDISPDGESIVAGDASGKIHFLHIDKPD